MAKRLNWRKVKKHRSYTVDEVARLLSVHKGTVRRWTKNGLKVLDDQRPLLILGPDLISFLLDKAPKKQTCKLDECYCLKCRKPRRPAYNEAEFMPDKAHSGRLRALCEECTTVMHKQVSLKHISALRDLINLDIRSPD